MEVYTAEASPNDHIALQIQLALAYLASEREDAAQFAMQAVEAVLPALRERRSKQQQSILVNSFGPAFAPYMTPARRAALEATVSKLEMRSASDALHELAAARLFQIVADPAQAGRYADGAVEALNLLAN